MLCQQLNFIKLYFSRCTDILNIRKCKYNYNQYYCYYYYYYDVEQWRANAAVHGSRLIVIILA